MKHDEAREWIKGNRSTTNTIPQDPFETWEVRISEADAARTQEAYWSLRAWNESLVQSPDEKGDSQETPEDKEISALSAALFKASKQRDDALRDAEQWMANFEAMERAGAEQAKRADENMFALRKMRDALQAIFDATDPYADGAPDATAHDKLCNEISALAREMGGGGAELGDGNATSRSGANSDNRVINKPS